MERKLATIRKIADITSMEGADTIECLHIDGWTVVAKKEEFFIGQNILYFEIDSWIPNNIAPFLTREGYEPREYGGVKGERLRTVKLRGQLSQGLVLDPHKIMSHDIAFGLQEGEDVTEVLGILKYEPPISACLAGQVRGNFPSHTPKTDEERIQNLKKYFRDYGDLEFEVSEKLDGSSCTVYNLDGDFGVCSRNLDLKEDENNSFWKTINTYNLREILKELNLNIAIQSELIGEGIQGNKYKLKGQDVRVFNIYDINKKRYLTSDERLEVLEKINTAIRSKGCKAPVLNSVPLLGTLRLRDFTMESLLLYAEGISQLFNTNREGIVCKSKELVNNQAVSFKCISNKFLLKNE
jgi:RNA ligase (TIGR02306 family)